MQDHERDALDREGTGQRANDLRPARTVAAQLERRRERQAQRADLREHGREEDEQREVAAVLHSQDARGEDAADDEDSLTEKPRQDGAGERHPRLAKRAHRQYFAKRSERGFSSHT